MNQALELLVIDRIEALLQALKEERVIRQFYYTPHAIAQSPEFPFAFFGLAADRDYALVGKDFGGPTYTVGSRILLSLVIKRESTYATKELAELKAVVRQRIVSDLPVTEADGNCRFRIEGLPTASDPVVANFYDDYAAATIAIDYGGNDDYFNNGG